MKRNKYILPIVFILLILSIVFTTVVFYQQARQQNIKTRADALDNIDQRMAHTYSEINSFPAGAADNLLFLSKLSELQKINISQNIKDIEKDFLEFLAQTEAYYQISFLNNSGVEIIRAESNKESRQIVPFSSKTNSENISYFNLVKNLKDGEVYVFPLDLNVKNDTIENRGDTAHPKYVPVLRYAVPVFNRQNNQQAGIILIKVYADYFLDSIRQSQREGEITFLIDNNGFYLANPDRNKEFSYLFNDKKNNFFTDYPLVSQKNMIDCNDRRQETGKQIFTYRCINPSTSNFEIYEGSKTIKGKSNSDYQWILVTVTDKNDGLKDFSQQTYDYLWVILIQILIQGTVFIFFLLNNRLYEKTN